MSGNAKCSSSEKLCQMRDETDSTEIGPADKGLESEFFRELLGGQSVFTRGSPFEPISRPEPLRIR